MATIVIGALVLMLPASSAAGEHTGFIDALFTSATSVCVTGLVVVDTYSHWSLLGQAVILFLIQIGGLGVVAVGSMIMLVSRRKFNLGDRMLLGDSLNIDRNRGLLQFLIRMFRGVFIVEGIGTVLCAIKFVPMFGWGKGLWASLFQSISAFCNAGMDVLGPDSLVSYRDSHLLLTVTMLLIILGGLGFVVWFDLIDGLKNAVRHRLSIRSMMSRLPEHSKIVLVMTAGLITAGALFIFVAEHDNPYTLGGMGMGDKIINSIFQSVTFRTAGFATIPQEHLNETSCIVGYILMFIGGSPVGTAGGIKTVTVFLFFMNAFSYSKGKKENAVFGKRISEESMRKSSAIVFVSALTVFVMTLLLMSRDGLTHTDAMYEIISALGTVGLSRGITPHLDSAGRIIVIISMYLGRIGPISMAVFFSKTGSGINHIRHAEGKFYVG